MPLTGACGAENASSSPLRTIGGVRTFRCPIAVGIAHTLRPLRSHERACELLRVQGRRHGRHYPADLRSRWTTVLSTRFMRRQNARRTRGPSLPGAVRGLAARPATFGKAAAVASVTDGVAQHARPQGTCDPALGRPTVHRNRGQSPNDLVGKEALSPVRLVAGLSAAFSPRMLLVAVKREAVAAVTQACHRADPLLPTVWSGR